MDVLQQQPGAPDTRAQQREAELTGIEQAVRDEAPTASLADLIDAARDVSDDATWAVVILGVMGGAVAAVLVLAGVI